VTAANWLVVLMGVQCAIASVLFLTEKQYPLALMFGGYTIANGAIAWASLKLAS
jgi:hypothetical protein